MKTAAALIGTIALAALGCAKKPPSLVGLWVRDTNENHFIEFFDDGRAQAIDGSGHWIGITRWTDPTHIRIDLGLHGEDESPPRIYAVTLTSDRLILKDELGHMWKYTRSDGRSASSVPSGKPYEVQRKEDAAIAEQLWALLDRGNKACLEARFDVAQAAYGKARQIVERNPRFRKSWAPGIEEHLIDVRVKRLLYADAEREFKEFQKRYNSHAAAWRQLLEEGRAIQQKTGDMKVPWDENLKMILGWLELKTAPPNK